MVLLLVMSFMVLFGFVYFFPGDIVFQQTNANLINAISISLKAEEHLVVTEQYTAILKFILLVTGEQPLQRLTKEKCFVSKLI